MLELREPVAVVGIQWLTRAEGGRASGPPPVGVYGTTGVFELGGERETEVGWPSRSSRVQSILVRRTGEDVGGLDEAELGFLVPSLASPYLKLGARLVILEGPRVVAHAVIVRLMPSENE